jgi:hypothetical protein
MRVPPAPPCARAVPVEPTTVVPGSPATLVVGSGGGPGPASQRIGSTAERSREFSNGDLRPRSVRWQTGP